MIHPGPPRLFVSLASALCFGGFAFAAPSLGMAALPFNSATVTKVENKVDFGERHGDRSTLRPAAVMDSIHSNNFVLSESESRAELQYPDGSVVRIGQNTIFSFDSDTRTLSLENGSLLFHIPKGAGGGTIKTPSLTAAITGTAGKVSKDIIAIVEGVVTLIPSGKLVHAGEFARHNADGSITIANFEADKVLDGKLVNFNGLMPGFTETPYVGKFTLPDDHFLQLLEESQNLPSSIRQYFPHPVEAPHSKKTVTATPIPATPAPKPRTTPTTPRPTPTRGSPPPKGTPLPERTAPSLNN